MQEGFPKSGVLVEDSFRKIAFLSPDDFIVATILPGKSCIKLNYDVGGADLELVQSFSSMSETWAAFSALTTHSITFYIVEYMNAHPEPALDTSSTILN